MVKLSIGGTHFTTSRSTLVPASGFFSVYLGGRFAQPTLDDAGATFVDRDAQHFPKILAFLRDGAIPQWSDEGEREALEREADFYQIEALMRVVGPAQNMVAAAGPTNERMRDEENELRALFVSARDDPRISHPHTLLIDVFSSLTTFVGGGVELDELRVVPTLARFHTHRPPATKVVSEENTSTRCVYGCEIRESSRALTKSARSSFSSSRMRSFVGPAAKTIFAAGPTTRMSASIW